MVVNFLSSRIKESVASEKSFSKILYLDRGTPFRKLQNFENLFFLESKNVETFGWCCYNNVNFLKLKFIFLQIFLTIFTALTVSNAEIGKSAISVIQHPSKNYKNLLNKKLKRENFNKMIKSK